MIRRIVLASESPRRRQILELAGLDFDIRPSGFDESALHGAADPESLVRLSATLKALEVARTEPSALVLGFDTAVVVDDAILGKPQDADEALRMVLRLAGREHRVLTGVCVIDTIVADLRGSSANCAASHGGPAGYSVECEQTFVRFGPLAPEQARAYVQKGESLDKAGAYGIQGSGCLLVESIRGCYYNVVGLPIYRLSRLLARVGVDLLKDPKRQTGV